MKMFCLFALFSLAASADFDDDLLLSSALNSPKQMVSLYSSFEKSHDRHYQPAEERMRLRIFAKTVSEVASLNSRVGWRSALNDFADKTEDEKRGYLGLNISRTTGPLSVSPPMLSSSFGAAPASKSWISKGAVTEVKNQGGCGSCWAFSAIVSLEGHYKTLTGVLRDMSEQNLLDCTYDWNEDGCKGGMMDSAIEWVRKSGRLASAAHYPYSGRSRYCVSKSQNVIKGAKISSYQYISYITGLNEQNTINALANGPISVAVKAIDSFMMYKSGIYSDSNRDTAPDHAIAAVAYTPTYILIKNSWGKTWGDNGYIKVARNYYGCAFHTYVGHPVLTSSGVTDSSPSDPATEYESSQSCEDNWPNCDLFKMYCFHDKVKNSCKKSCNNCNKDDGDSDGSCPSGTKRCPDGKCRHVHMC